MASPTLSPSSFWSFVHGDLPEAANIPGRHRDPSSVVVVMLDGFSLAAKAAQLGIALYLTGVQNSNG